MRLQVSKHARMVVDDDEGPAVLLHLWTNQQVHLNESAGFFFHRLYQGEHQQEVLRNMGLLYETPVEQLETDLGPLVRQLIKMRFLKVVR